MGEQNEVADQLSEVNLAEGFWKSWGELETEASAEIKNPKLVRHILRVNATKMTGSLGSVVHQCYSYKDAYDKH
eukprot:g68527.t1